MEHFKSKNSHHKNLLAHKVLMSLKKTAPRHSNRNYWYQSPTEQSQNLKLSHQEHFMSKNVKGFIAPKLLPRPQF